MGTTESGEMKLAIELGKLLAIVAVFAVTVPLLYLGRWLLVAGFTGMQWASSIGKRGLTYNRKP